VENPKLKIYATAAARDNSILDTSEVTEENLEALLKQSEQLGENDPDLLVEKVTLTFILNQKTELNLFP
jgi:hypothetical protein